MATPEDVRQLEISRLRAKAAQRAKDQQLNAASSSSTRKNDNNKRPLARDSRLGTYFDYDLSKMGHSKGGFLIEDNGENEEETRRRQIEKERQRERREHNIGEDLPVHVDGPRCEECDAVDIDAVFLKVFRVNVCKKCQNEKPEKYSLLTKTECKEDYLLTDPELRDADLMPHLLKANPHKSTYANMMLYLRCQVEAFAWTKWGSPEALDAEYARRQAEKDKKKSKKFEESLKELRKRTKENLWEKRQAGLHRHVFGPVRDGEQKCDCGLVIEVDEF